MQKRSLETCFEDFRSRGDTGALGFVFDQTAAELLRVARHLTHGASEAEDLLQATFLTAIERAPAYDVRRPLRPWLLGILVKHASHARRRGSRFLETDRLWPAREREPQEIVLEAELASAVEQALEGLPPVYREVLEPRLREGTKGVEIARQVGRDPAVVRSQIRRGLALLRGALPRGLLASLLLLLGSRRSLAAVRARVLRHAALGAASGGAAAVSTVMGGLVVSKNSLLAALGIVAAVSGTIYFTWPEDRAPAEVAAAGAALRTEEDASNAPRPEPAAPPSRESVAPKTALVAPAAPAAIDPPNYPASYARHLSGVTGRLVSAGGEPAALLEVCLLELRPECLFGLQASAFAAALAAPRIELSRTRTGADGRFRLEGAHGRALHGLGIDLGGPRAALRAIDVALPPGELTDLGDVLLDPVVAFFGLVVDEEGRPIAGARVRTANVPAPVAALGIQHARSDSDVIRLDEPAMVFDLPPWLGAWFDRLPVPTAYSGADGRFRIEGAPRGVVTTVIDHQDFVAAVVGPTPSGQGGERDLGTITLAEGRTLLVRVADAKGRAIAGAEVIGGPVAALGAFAFGRPAKPGAEDGVFVLDALPEDSDLVVAARTSAIEPWRVEGPFDAEEVTLTLPAAVSLTVRLEDESQRPVEEAEIRLSPARLDDFPIESLRAYAAPGGRLENVGGGYYRIAGLAPGSYTLAVKAPGLAVMTEVVTIGEDDAHASLVLPRGQTVLVRVLEEATGSAIEHAEVAVLSSGAPEGALLREVTNAAGAASLGPFHAASETGALLQVEHPGYAHASVPIRLDDQVLEVRLSSGGGAAGRLTVDGQPPREAYSVVILEQEASASLSAPWLAVTDALGAFALSHMRPGFYRYEVYRRCLNGDLLAAAMEMNRMSPLAEGPFRVEAGKVASLDIEIHSPAGGAACVVRGTIRANGEPMAGTRVQAVSSDPRENFGEADEQGRYEITGVQPGEVELVVWFAQKKGTSTILQPRRRDTIHLAPGQQWNQDYDFTTYRVSVRVCRQGSEEPLEDARVTFRGAEPANQEASAFGLTDEDGEVSIELTAAGSFTLMAAHPGAGQARQSVIVPAGFTTTLELDPGAPCAGTFSTPQDLAPPADCWIYLRFLGEGTGEPEALYLPLERGAQRGGRFSIAGLEPGNYTVSWGWGSGGSLPLAFTLPPEGSTNLFFDFQAAP
ncbi:MAG: sigma-70 family RNA polymerase sigma factor [Planctomycetes bacterium]|nr:sigma-70 family RNA polymerase sigma factor [Planctomycetota bacterium]